MRDRAMVFLKYAGYVAFFFVMLLFGIYLTFPWDAAKDRVLEYATKTSGMKLEAESLEPSWLTGVSARNVKITPQGATEPIALERINARANLLALITGKQGGSVSLPIAKGEIDADVILDEETQTIRGSAEGIELGLVPGLVEATGLPLTGSIDVATDVVIGVKDQKLTNGELTLKVKGLKLEKGGKIRGFPVPELAIGDADWKIPIESGKATLKNLKLSGENVELILDGTIAVLSPPSRSTANFSLSFKPTDKLLKAEPLLGSLLNNIQQAKGNDGFFTYQVVGIMKSPRFTPRRK